MKATGFIRRFDDLGRIVIPKEIRRTCHLRECDPMEIYVGEDGEIILCKYDIEPEITAFKDTVRQLAETITDGRERKAFIESAEKAIRKIADGM